MEKTAGGMLVLSLSAPTNQRVEDIVPTKHVVNWRNRIGTVIQAAAADVSVYGEDPAGGAAAWTVPAGSILSLDYNGPLWVTSTGNVTILGLY